MPGATITIVCNDKCNQEFSTNSFRVFVNFCQYTKFVHDIQPKIRIKSDETIIFYWIDDTHTHSTRLIGVTIDLFVLFFCFFSLNWSAIKWHRNTSTSRLLSKHSNFFIWFSTNSFENGQRVFIILNAPIYTISQWNFKRSDMFVLECFNSETNGSFWSQIQIN